MKQSIALLQELSDGDVEWLLSSASERRTDRGETLIPAGETVDAIHLVLQGLLHVSAPEAESPLAVLGPGDLVGEMSFLEERAATESVTVAERTTTLTIPHAALHDRCRDDPAFAGRLHRSLARLVSRRLRAANRRLAVASDTDAVSREAPAPWHRLSESMDRFKEDVHALNEAAAEHGGTVPEERAEAFVEDFLRFAVELDEAFRSEELDERLREEMGLRAQREFLPYLLLTETAERFYTKPRGYAGDYWTIELIYRNEPAGSNAVGRLIDRGFLELAACHAARNRRGLLADEIQKTLEARGNEADGGARITSLACGPAREVFDIFSDRDGSVPVHATLLDIDDQALDFVRGTSRRLGLEGSVSLLRENLIHLALGRVENPMEDQDLVYSIGLIDYLDDDLVVRLMNLVHTMLRPGGRIILGNFHPRNSTRAIMDHILDWKLIHRTEEDMDRLYRQSAFGRPSTNIRFEDEGINLFAECVRE